AHPGTSELVYDAVRRAITVSGLQKGVFGIVFDDGHDAGVALVKHPLIRAVGFTGSLAGGDALRKIAAERPEPIPVYAEMGSINPQFLLPNAVRKRGAEIAAGLHASFTLGTGQYCTNPGVVLLPAGPEGDALLDELAARTRETRAGTMLTAGICSAYGQGLHRLRAGGATLVAEGPEGSEGTGRASVWEAELTSFTDPALLEEVFGPCTLVLRYQDADQLREFVPNLQGQLTASIHGQAGELGDWAWLARLLQNRAGRVIINQFPTGVEVTDAMVHGGPYPATSDGRTTSVGGRAIERFARLVAWQNFPQELLPKALRD
ncbi:MAG TPA: aldehyde dehydrogenase family protein, partial [Deinococcales bacterium]|nr:aldehyde dehydrogenase family protein [Deinococcales bacterium]